MVSACIVTMIRLVRGRDCSLEWPLPQPRFGDASRGSGRSEGTFASTVSPASSTRSGRGQCPRRQSFVRPRFSRSWGLPVKIPRRWCPTALACTCRRAASKDPKRFAVPGPCALLANHVFGTRLFPCLTIDIVVRNTYYKDCVAHFFTSCYLV